MKVSFLSIDENRDKICFESEVSFKNGQIWFQDGSQTETRIGIERHSWGIVFRRIGAVETEMTFWNGKKTHGRYRNREGLEFSFEVLCQKCEMTERRILIHYLLILDERIQTRHKISLFFQEPLAKSCFFE